MTKGDGFFPGGEVTCEPTGPCSFVLPCNFPGEGGQAAGNPSSGSWDLSSDLTPKPTPFPLYPSKQKTQSQEITGP